MDPTIVAGGLKLVGGLFGRKKSMTPGQSIQSSARGARAAAEKYGFNALTLLQNSNLTAGAGMDMGTPPLASLAVLGDIVEENWGKTAEDEDVRREHNKLQNELLRLEVDRARGAMRAVEGVSHAAGGVITGARTVKTFSSPVTGDYLDENDRNPAVADERDVTVSMQSHGQESVVPLGFDWDELVTGALIDANNRRKAFLAKHTVGAPLRMPQKFIPVPLVGGNWVNDPAALLPPKNPRPKARPKSWDNYVDPNTPLQMWQ